MLDQLKPGLDEKLYENALVLELRAQGHQAEQQRQYPVHYREHHLYEHGSAQCIRLSVEIDGVPHSLTGEGNGPINAFVHALEGAGLKDFKVTDYRSHAVRGGSDASAASYVQVQHDDGRLLWGAGVDPSIEMAGLKALVTAWNLLRV